MERGRGVKRFIRAPIKRPVSPINSLPVEFYPLRYCARDHSYYAVIFLYSEILTGRDFIWSTINA